MGVKQVIESGEDQLKSHYNLIFPTGIPLGGSGTNVILRCNKTFETPPDDTETYDIFFHGVKYPQTGNVSEDKTFSLIVRLSKDWAEYKDIKRWLDKVRNPHSNGRLPDAVLRTTFILQPIDIDADGNETPSRTPITFYAVKIKGISGVDFDHQSTNEPVEYTLSFIYGWKNDLPY